MRTGLTLRVHIDVVAECGGKLARIETVVRSMDVDPGPVSTAMEGIVTYQNKQCVVYRRFGRRIIYAESHEPLLFEGCV